MSKWAYMMLLAVFVCSLILFAHESSPPQTVTTAEAQTALFKHIPLKSVADYEVLTVQLDRTHTGIGLFHHGALVHRYLVDGRHIFKQSSDPIKHSLLAQWWIYLLSSVIIAASLLLLFKHTRLWKLELTIIVILPWSQYCLAHGQLLYAMSIGFIGLGILACSCYYRMCQPRCALPLSQAGTVLMNVDEKIPAPEWTQTNTTQTVQAFGSGFRPFPFLRKQKIIDYGCWSLVAIIVSGVVLLSLDSHALLDAGIAGIRGATILLGTHLPYGHMSVPFHGDTYPIGLYMWYIPSALLAPYHDGLDAVSGAQWAPLVCWLITIIIATWHVYNRYPQQASLMILTGVAFLPIVASLYLASSDVIIACLMLAAIINPLTLRALSILTIILWSKIVTILLLPAWFIITGRWMKGVIIVSCISLPFLAVLYMIGGFHAFEQMWHAMSYQWNRRSLQSPAILLYAPWLRIICQACCVTGVIASLYYAWKHQRALRMDRRRVAACWLVIVIAIQLFANYWTPLYLCWVLPLWLVSFFPPQTSR